MPIIVHAASSTGGSWGSGFVSPMPIAIPDFYSDGGANAQVGVDVAGVVAADLERSGLFKPIPKSAFIQDSASLQQSVRFGDWRLINADAVVVGYVRPAADGRHRRATPAP